MQDNEKESRADGYKNLMNKYGTQDDVSEQYRFESDDPVTDVELTLNYEENGLFAKIIDIPSDDAVSSGFEYGVNDVDLETFINDSLDELDFEGAASTAIKWSRLYGGSLMVMIIDDGKQIDEPVDWDNIRGIDELLVFERPLITPDYNSIYNHDPKTGKWSKFGKPEFYDVSPMYGKQFRVHESRCLLFKNGTLPQSSSRTEYRFFGMPEYTRIHKALQETVTSHGNGVKLLDRAVQAIYKMNDLANLLETDEGEDIVLRRLRIIDMAKGIINSIAIDANGEDYDYKTVTFSGVKDIIDATCNMLSAVTNIPQTILFGRSPAGMNATGDSDLENYYNMVENIQKQNMKANARTVIDLILKQGLIEGKIPEIPKYKMKFAALWSLSDTEQADIAQKKATTEQTKAQTAQVYIDSGVLDPSEVRSSLATEGEFDIEEVITEDDLNLPEDTFSPTEMSGTSESDDFDLQFKSEAEDGTDYGGAAVLVIKNGKILCASRRSSEGICGPGGHIEDGETPEEAALREAQEEFNIVPLNILPLGVYKSRTGSYCDSMIYFTDQFTGTPEADGVEMLNERWLSLEELKGKFLFPPFEESLKMLEDLLGR